MTEVTTTRFVRPGSLEEAVGILRDGPGKWTLLAGGTDLLVRMRDGAVRPEGVIDLTGVREMSDIGVVEGHVVVGALVTLARLAGDDGVRRHGMALAEAADLVRGDGDALESRVRGEEFFDLRRPFFGL